MLKKTLFVASAAIALAATLSAPASANINLPTGTQPPTQRVPEPTTVFGLLSLAGAGLFATKRADSHKKAQ